MCAHGISIMLVEATKENGTTEVWLGTHRNTTIADHVSEGESKSNRAMSSAFDIP